MSRPAARAARGDAGDRRSQHRAGHHAEPATQAKVASARRRWAATSKTSPAGAASAAGRRRRAGPGRPCRAVGRRRRRRPQPEQARVALLGDRDAHRLEAGQHDAGRGDAGQEVLPEVTTPGGDLVAEDRAEEQQHDDRIGEGEHHPAVADEQLSSPPTRRAGRARALGGRGGGEGDVPSGSRTSRSRRRARGTRPPGRGGDGRSGTSPVGEAAAGRAARRRGRWCDRGAARRPRSSGPWPRAAAAAERVGRAHLDQPAGGDHRDPVGEVPRPRRGSGW